MPSAQVIPADGFTNKLESNIRGGNAKARTQCATPLVYSGTLDKFSSRDSTPVIGREYEGLQVTELLESDNEQLIKDLAVTSELSAAKTAAMRLLTSLQFHNEELSS